MNRCWLGTLLSVLLILGVGAAIYFSARVQLSERQVVTVRGLIGSEKEEFFSTAQAQPLLPNLSALFLEQGFLG